MKAGNRQSSRSSMQSCRTTRSSDDGIVEKMKASWSDPHVLVPPYTFGKVPLQISEKGSKDQPFLVKVHPQATFICDLHAHMCDAEIIGLLAGKWSAAENCLYVQASFPCFSTVRMEDDGSTDVEMDPGAEIATRDAIQRLGLQVVGWYHSHPRFQPDPSTTDITNQHSYQALFRDNIADMEPFVGLIISTFDNSRIAVESLHQWFYTVPLSATKAADDGLYLPMKIDVIHMSVASNHVPVCISCTDEASSQMEDCLLGIDPNEKRSTSCKNRAEKKRDDSDFRSPRHSSIASSHACSTPVGCNDAQANFESKDKINCDASLVHFNGCGGVALDDDDDVSYIGSEANGTGNLNNQQKVVSESCPAGYSFIHENACTSVGTSYDQDRKRPRRSPAANGRYSDYMCYFNSNDAVKRPMGKQHVPSASKKVKASRIVPKTNVCYAIENNSNTKKLVCTSKSSEKVRSASELECHREIQTMSLISGLQRDTVLASRARKLVCSASPPIQCIMLAVVTLGLYYSQHKRRTMFTKAWRKKTKLDKVKSSALVWLKYFGMTQVDEEALLDNITSFLSLCWKSGNR